MTKTKSHEYIGQSVTRLEDARMLTGSGNYVDDIKLPGMAVMAIYRSPHAHAYIKGIDLSKARSMEGVLDVFSAIEIGHDIPFIPLRLAPFDGFERFLQRPIAFGKVRYVGEPVCVVIAQDRYLAEDALELIDIDFEPLPAITNIEQSADGKILVHEEADENLAAHYSITKGDISGSCAGAAYTRRERFQTNRHAAVPLETRGLIADFDIKKPLLQIYGATKVNFFNRRHIATALGLEENAVELIETDVGGGFGARGELYPEDYLVPIASRRVGRPVKWIEDRAENLMAMNHSRDIICELEISATEDGRILGMRGLVQGDMGAYVRTNGGTVASKGAQYLPGPYRIPAISFEVQFLVTNKTPVGTFRGPGRFETNFFRERLLDLMAGDLGIDPAEIRLRNLIEPAELPYRLGKMVPGDPDVIFDRGDYPSVLKRLLNEAAYEDWKDRQGETFKGRAYGLGIACFIEGSAAGPPESARIDIEIAGNVEVRTGASSVGQGTETGLAQICAERLDVDIDSVNVLHGSTTLVESGGGTFNSRNTVMAGNAVSNAADALHARAIELAALRWNTDRADLSYESGGVRRAGFVRNNFLTLGELSAFADTRGETLSAEGSFDNNQKLSYSYGAHAALVAVDVATGIVEVKQYNVVEEIGRALNPALVQGQAVGGVVQGLGGTFLDHMVYSDDGQLLTGNFSDYLLPTSTRLPEINSIALEEFPSEFNPLGFKGAGEGGIAAVAAAVGNAVAQALKPHGILINKLPLTPDRLRECLRAAGA